MKVIKVLLVLLALSFSSISFAVEVNINTADAEQMAEALKGVGMAKARAIIDYREQNGNFSTIDDLVNVPGIGAKTVEKNKDRMRLSSN